ncbi:MAG TPA: adenylosuccinate lyase, partial [Anaerolineae bacterium]
FAATERVLMAAAKAGADRQEMHELIREHSLAAWADIAAGKSNPLAQSLAADERLTRYLNPERLATLLDAGQYVGDAPDRARQLAAQIRTEIGGG